MDSKHLHTDPVTQRNCFNHRTSNCRTFNHWISTHWGSKSWAALGCAGMGLFVAVGWPGAIALAAPTAVSSTPLPSSPVSGSSSLEGNWGENLGEVTLDAFSDSTLQAASTLLFVSPSGGNDEVGNGSQRSPFRTLTQALSAAQSGTVIILGPGIYGAENGEQFPIQLKPGVMVQGNPSAQGQGILIRGGGHYLSPTFARQNVAVLGADHAVLTGVTITNPNNRGYGLWIESCSPLITGNTFSQNVHDGVAIAGDSAPTVQGNFFQRNGANGMTIYGTSQPQIQGNLFENTGFGINIGQDSAPRLLDNRIWDNRAGVIVQGNARPLLRRNVIEYNRQDGLVALAQSRPDLGTAEDPGQNRFSGNGQADINAEVAAHPLMAVGNTLNLEKTSGQIRTTAPVARIGSGPTPSPQPLVESLPPTTQASASTSNETRVTSTPSDLSRRSPIDSGIDSSIAAAPNPSSSLPNPADAIASPPDTPSGPVTTLPPVTDESSTAGRITQPPTLALSVGDDSPNGSSDSSLDESSSDEALAVATSSVTATDDSSIAVAPESGLDAARESASETSASALTPTEILLLEASQFGTALSDPAPSANASSPSASPPEVAPTPASASEVSQPDITPSSPERTVVSLAVPENLAVDDASSDDIEQRSLVSAREMAIAPATVLPDPEEAIEIPIESPESSPAATPAEELASPDRSILSILAPVPASVPRAAESSESPAIDVAIAPAPEESIEIPIESPEPSPAATPLEAPASPDRSILNILAPVPAASNGVGRREASAGELAIAPEAEAIEIPVIFPDDSSAQAQATSAGTGATRSPSSPHSSTNHGLAVDRLSTVAIAATPDSTVNDSSGESSLPPDHLLPVPGSSVPEGHLGSLSTVHLQDDPLNSALLTTAPSIVRARTRASLQYRVLVEANTYASRVFVTSLVPDAFMTTIDGRQLMQIGAYSELENANDIARELVDWGLQVEVQRID